MKNDEKLPLAVLRGIVGGAGQRQAPPSVDMALAGSPDAPDPVAVTGTAAPAQAVSVADEIMAMAKTVLSEHKLRDIAPSPTGNALPVVLELHPQDGSVIPGTAHMSEAVEASNAGWSVPPPFAEIGFSPATPPITSSVLIDPAKAQAATDHAALSHSDVQDVLRTLGSHIENSSHVASILSHLKTEVTGPKEMPDILNAFTDAADQIWQHADVTMYTIHDEVGAIETVMPAPKATSA